MATVFDRKVVSSSMIGLDIGSSAVRAVEITRSRARKGLTLRRFGQIPLPPGAVTDGEIRDPAAVVKALRRLWSETGFRSRNVVVGVSGQRVVVRQAEVPAMSESDFRSALRYQAMDLIPLPVDDALLDFVILPPPPGESKQADRMQILLAAAHRTVIDSYLAVLRDASLHPVALDPAPIALVRATERVAAVPGEAVAIVDLGSDLTVISVGEAGRVRYSRILKRGGSDVTQRLAARLALGVAEAEDIKRTGDDAGGMTGLSAEDLDPLASEIEGTLSFFSDQMGPAPLHSVLLTGGGSGSPELVRQLATRRHGTTRVLDALDGLDRTDPIPRAEGSEGHSSSALLAIGAAEWAFEQPSRRLSLLPSELAEAAAARRQIFAAAALVAILASGLTSLSLVRAHKTSAAKQQASSIQTVNDEFQGKINQLGTLSSVLAAVQSRLALVRADQVNNIAWPLLLKEVTQAMPPGTTLTSFSVSDTPSATVTSAAAPSTATLGSLTMSVTAKGTEEQVAVWLRAFADVKGISAPFVPSASAGDGIVTFTSSAAIVAGAPMVKRLPTTDTSS